MKRALKRHSFRVVVEGPGFFVWWTVTSCVRDSHVLCQPLSGGGQSRPVDVGWLVGWLVRYSFKLRGWKHPALAKWSLPVLHPFVQSNSESKDPCTLLIEDRQTLKPLENVVC